jgi:hypothetical protein
MAEVKFPTEVVDLPSKGLLYPEDHPLASGKVEIRYMTAKDEDILTSPNLIKQGVVLDKLIQNLIVDKSIKLGDMLTGDKNALLIAIRILGYGKDYAVEIEGKQVDIDLTKMKDKKLNKKNITTRDNRFDFELPATKRKVQFKLLTSADEEKISQETKAIAKVTGGVQRNLTTRYKHQIISVDGNEDRAYINSFVDNELLSRDSIALRTYIDSIAPDVDMTWHYIDEDGERREFLVPVTVQFFWPTLDL